MSWQPIETAPKDGTHIQAEIPGYGDDNVIAWVDGLYDEDMQDASTWAFIDDEGWPDCWSDGVCWRENAEGKPSVKPSRWRAQGESE